MKALLVSGGSIKDIDFLKRVGENINFIICADGGTNYCLNADLTPNIIIGDLDSISEDSLKIIKDKKIPIIKFPVKKDNTDTELAIDYLIKKGFDDITIIGGIGSRMDHTLANIFLLKKLKDRGVQGKILDGNNIIYLVDNELTIKNTHRFYVSIIPITDYAIVTLDGFKYNLSEMKIGFSSTLGISNEIKEDIGYVKIHKGRCLVFLSMD